MLVNVADEITSTQQRIVYLNGQTPPASEARLSLDDHGVLYGLGFFETFRTSGGYPHHWERHRRRLLQACATAHIKVPSSFLANDEARLREAIQCLLSRNGLNDGVFRYTVTAGPPSNGCPAYEQPTEFMMVRPLPPPAAPEGVTLRVMKIPRDSGEWLPRPKSLNYSNSVLGGCELRQRGAARDDEGLFLTRDGKYVVEAVRHNLAWIANGCFLYADPTLGAVAGTCLQWILDLGIDAEPGRIDVEGLLRAEAVVLLNSVRGVTPVQALWDASDRSMIGSWKSHAHPLVITLRQQWNDSIADTAAGGNG